MILTKDFDFPGVLQDLLRVAAYDDAAREIPSVVFDIWNVLQPARGDALVVAILKIKTKLSQWQVFSLLRVAANDDTAREIPAVVFDIWNVLQPTRGDALVVSILRE